MATKKSSTQMLEQSKTQRFNKAEFNNYELTKADVLRMKKEFIPKLEIPSLLDKLVEDGYRVTMKWDGFGNCPACWLQPIDAKNVNYGVILTGRGKTATNALIEVSFKHYMVFEGAWPARDDKPGVTTWDDD